MSPEGRKLIITNQKLMKANGPGLIYPELSYRLMGALFSVHNQLGNSYQEKYYQRSIEIELAKSEIPFKKEHPINLEYSGNKIGRYFIDFVIEDKIILEIKTVPYVTPLYLRQLYSYLKVTGYRLGIVANFKSEKLSYKRLVNPRAEIVNN